MSIEMYATKSTANRSQTMAPLFLYFWLPAGKDAFGFNNWKDASLCVFKEYYDDLYLPIALQFFSRYKSVYFSQKDVFTLHNDLANVVDSGLNLRKIESSFTYQPEEKPKFVKTRDINGEFTLFSSGLYVFRFDIEVDDSCTNPYSINTAKDFAATFFKDVIHPLFDLDWQKYLAFLDKSGHLVLTEKNFHGAASAKSNALASAKEKEEEGANPDAAASAAKKKPTASTKERSYNGVLNYYQLDLLYNCVFDAEAVPQVFFGRTTAGEPEPQKDKIAEIYSLKNIIGSLVMVSWGKQKRKYAPLRSDRKNYSLRGAYEYNDDNYFKPETFFWKPDDTDAINTKGFFYARLTYSAMEQFIRVAITFGLASYRDGLSCTRKTILLHNMRAKENIEPHQLYLETKLPQSATIDGGSQVEQESPNEEPEPQQKRLIDKIRSALLNRWNAVLKRCGLNPEPDDQNLEEETAAQEPPGDKSEFAPIVFTLNFAEIYYELIKSKIPSLFFLRDLLRDVSEVVAPQQTEQVRSQSKEAKAHYFHEYEYSKKTLDEALSQFKRKCDVIQTKTEALRHLMERSDDRQILSELTDTRKIHELNAEDRIKVEISPEQWSRLSIAIGYMQVGVGFAFGILALATWLIDKIVTSGNIWSKIVEFLKSNLLSGDHLYISVAYLIPVLLALWRFARNRPIWRQFLILSCIAASVNLAVEPEQKAALVLWAASFAILLSYLAWDHFKAKAKNYAEKLEPQISGVELCTSIYDFANLRHPIQKKYVMELFQQWKSSAAMPKLFGKTRELVRCRVFNLLSEMPSVGVEKRKYSFGSPATGATPAGIFDSKGANYPLAGENYTLHVEIELHHPSNDAFLTDIRLAVRTMPEVGSRVRNIDLEVKRLVYHFCSAIMPEPATSQSTLNTILKRHFAFSDLDIRFNRRRVRPANDNGAKPAA